MVHIVHMGRENEVHRFLADWNPIYLVNVMRAWRNLKSSRRFATATVTAQV